MKKDLIFRKITCRPVLKYMLGDVCGRIIRGESEVLCFPTDQNKAEVHLQQWKKKEEKKKTA